MDTSALIERWRREADLLRRHGAVEAAATKEADARELEAFTEEYQLQTLSLAEAAAISGFSASHLGLLVNRGAIPNRGKPGGRPKIARKDLPKKAPRVQTPLPRRPDGTPDLVGAVIPSTERSSG
jgi:hypothetical protein